MRQRSKAGGEPAKTQRRKTVAPKRRNTLEAGPERWGALQEQLDIRTQELREALEQQAATSRYGGGAEAQCRSHR